MPRNVLRLLIPEGGVVLAAAALLLWRALPDRGHGVLTVLPSLTLVAGVLLAWRFERGRMLAALLALALAGAAILGASSGDAPGLAGTLPAAAVLLPLNVLACYLVRERGLLTRGGLVLLAVLALQAAVVLWVGDMGHGSILDRRVLPTPVHVRLPMSDLAFLAFTGAIGTLIAFGLRQPTPDARGFLWGLVAAGLGVAVARPDATTGATVYFTAAGAVLIVSMIEASYRMAYRDALTGLRSRRALDETLERLSGDYTVAMIDIDRFKKLNDRHGHDVGDQVLKMVAAVLEGAAGGGRAYRYGGEEFAILFRGKALDESLPYLERVRTGVEGASFTLRDPDRPRTRPHRPRRRRGAAEIGVTVSIGAAQRNGRGMSVPEVVSAADEALYRAKRAGRNRIVSGDESRARR